MKTAVIFFHKNSNKNYSLKWIQECSSSIKNQTFQDFDVFEIDYGGDHIRHCEKTTKNKYVFFNQKFENHIYAMNFLITKVFSLGYDVVFNTNIDDSYHKTRFEKQLKKIKDGYQLVSSNFYYVNQDNCITKKMDFAEHTNFQKCFNEGNNIIAHPAVCMHKSFWDMDLHYNDMVGYEDLDLWKRAINKGKKFFIVPDFLLNYRIHSNQITKQLNPVMKKREAITEVDPATIQAEVIKEIEPLTKVNLLIIATNKYISFLEGLLDSANINFIKSADIDVVFNVFTNRISDARKILSAKPYFSKIVFLEIQHKAWPGTTLYRYHHFKRYKNSLKNADYNFYIDADTLIKKPIGIDILSDRTVVRHCGFMGKRGSYETNPNSTSFVKDTEGSLYYGGGFWGFSKDEFFKMLDVAITMIETDAANNIIPVWHDESVLNRYLIDNPPFKALSPSYHYPETPGILPLLPKYECIILLLNKNHADLRKDENIDTKEAVEINGTKKADNKQMEEMAKAPEIKRKSIVNEDTVIHQARPDNDSSGNKSFFKRRKQQFSEIPVAVIKLNTDAKPISDNRDAAQIFSDLPKTLPSELNASKSIDVGEQFITWAEESWAFEKIMKNGFKSNGEDCPYSFMRKLFVDKINEITPKLLK